MKKLDYDKIKFFGKNIYNFCGRFKIKKPFIVKPDKRYRTTTAEVLSGRNRKTGKKGYIIKYNPKEISGLEYWKINYVVLHELGHVKTKQSGNEFDREYRAEKFAHDMIKKHFQPDYPKYCKYISWYIDFAKDDIYKKAFIKLSKKLKRNR